MYIAQSKRKENIAEYILYLWQLEDLLRALQFSPEAVYSQLVQKQERLSEQQKQQALVWYMELAGLLREEGKEQSGHLEHTMHLIADLDNLHRQLLTLPAGENYRRLYGAVAPELPGLKSKLGKPGMSDVELFFRALYAVMLYRIKGDRSKQGYIDDVIGLISPVVAELATMFRRIERGEVDLFGNASRWPICCRPGIGRPGFPFRFSEPLVDWAVESSFPFRTPDLARGCSGGSGHGADGIPPDLGFRPFRPRIVVGIGHFFARHVAVRSCSQRESVPAEESGTGADAEVSRKRSVKELRNRERNL